MPSREFAGNVAGDQRMERMEGELKALADRVRDLEGETEMSPARHPGAQRAEIAVGSPSSGGEDEMTSEEPVEIQRIEFRSVESFEHDLGTLSKSERESVIDAINAKSQLLLNDRAAAEAAFVRPFRVMLGGALESSLSAVEVGGDYLVLLTVDEDPVFGQVIVTLLRAIRRGQLERSFGELVERLYPGRVLIVQTPDR